MYHNHILGDEILVCLLGSNFAWPPKLELSIICCCMVAGWKGYGIGIHFSNRNSAVSFESLYRTMNLLFTKIDYLHSLCNSSLYIVLLLLVVLFVLFVV